MRATAVRGLLCCILGFGLMAPVGGVQAQTPAEGAPTVESLFAAGTEAFDGGQYDAALDAFKAAYALQAVPDILYMVGRSYELNRDYREALNTYRKVHKHAGVSKKTSGYAADGIIKLEELFPSEYTLSIAYQPTSATLLVDGLQTGTGGLAKVKKKPGTYGLKLSAAGFHPYEGQVALESSSQVVLTLQEVPPPPKFLTPPAPPTDWKRPAGWVSVTFGALAGAAGSLFLVQAQDQADAANASNISTTYDSHKEAAEFNEAMAFGHYGAALIGVGLGVLWLATATDAAPLAVDTSGVPAAADQGASR